MIRRAMQFAALVLSISLSDTAHADSNTFWLGPASTVTTPTAFSPNGYAPDGPVFSLRANNEIRLFVSVAIDHSRFATYFLRGPSLGQLNNYQERVIGPGCAFTTGCRAGPDNVSTERVFDACGAWLLGAITPSLQGGRIEGFYHAEELCNYSNNGQTLKSIGAAVSQNSGLNFRRLGQVLSGRSEPPSDDTPSGTPPFGGVFGQGDQSVIEWQGMPWMYFSGSDNAGPTGVARRDAAGVWNKWNGTSFSEPALGGASAGLSDVWARSASKTTSNEIYLIGFRPGQSGNSVFLWRSLDGLNFTSSQKPILALSDVQSGSEQIQYPSLIPPGGDSYRDAWSANVYLFYGLEDREYNHNTATMSAISGNRKLVRREITVSTNPGSEDVFLVALSRYFNATRLDHWITTQVTDPDYYLEFILGYVLTAPEQDTTPLFECYIPDWDDHMLATDPNCGGWPVIRRVGWIYTQPSPGRVPLVRCFIPPWTNHFANNSVDCGGWTIEMTLGYLVQ
jgi:hypothetical protein